MMPDGFICVYFSGQYILMLCSYISSVLHLRYIVFHSVIVTHTGEKLIDSQNEASHPPAGSHRQCQG